MLNKIFKSEQRLPLTSAGQGLTYSASLPAGPEMRNVERAFARLFSTEDGQAVLAYLQVLTFQRTLGPLTPNEQLRYQEGQRALMATILRLIDRGRKA